LRAAAPEIDVPMALVDDTLLCISELVTNALLASCEHVTVDLVIERDRVRVVVTDNGQGWPTRRHPSPNDPHGRGLMIIEALAQRWGVTPAGDTKSVWAELAATG
jgi:anti-sigma regulatory factor (Ser/Thr protein kinase)